MIETFLKVKKWAKSALIIYFVNLALIISMAIAIIVLWVREVNNVFDPHNVKPWVEIIVASGILFLFIPIFCLSIAQLVLVILILVNSEKGGFDNNYFILMIVGFFVPFLHLVTLFIYALAKPKNNVSSSNNLNINSEFEKK